MLVAAGLVADPVVACLAFGVGVALEVVVEDAHPAKKNNPTNML